MTVMTGAFGDKPVKYKDLQDYLSQYGKADLVPYVNNYISEHRPDLPEFEITEEFRSYFEQYVKDHAEQRYVTNPDGSYDSIRLNNLAVDAVADFLHI